MGSGPGGVPDLSGMPGPWGVPSHGGSGPGGACS